MIRRTADIAARACRDIKDGGYVVATDNDKILNHCGVHEIPVIMTSPDLGSGTDRARAAYRSFAPEAKYIINLQGDAPFTDVAHIATCYKALLNGPDVATPYVKLSWDDLDILRENKKATPFSGTTLIHDSSGRAIWFSKNIIPSIKHEAKLRSEDKLSPVCRHIGLYLYTVEALERYVTLPKSHYETIEDLEQLRMIEAGFHVAAVPVQPAQISMSGIDSPQDLERAAEALRRIGDPYKGTI
jgi:3-deoxy-manno-octulosonate cytidylyltransferase (CMP-KDO synthetase)